MLIHKLTSPKKQEIDWDTIKSIAEATSAILGVVTLSLTLATTIIEYKKSKQEEDDNDDNEEE
jgi:hypothetical protein